MFDRLKQMVEQAAGIHDGFRAALRRSFSGSAVRRCLDETPRDQWVTAIASVLRVPEIDVLHKAAAALRLSATTSLTVPSPELVKSTGFSQALLAERRIIPQPTPLSPTGYVLIAADPESLRIKDFSARGVRVLLGLAREIDTVWTIYRAAAERRKIGLPPAIAGVLYRIAEDAHRLGGREAFLGHPSNDSYEFRTEKGVFSGNIHPRVVEETRAFLKDSPELSLIPDSLVLQSVRAALTKNFEHEIVCLSWIPQEAQGEIDEPDLGDIPTAGDAPPRIDSHYILLVEDDDRFAAVLTRVLESKELRVRRTRNGEEALKFLDECEHEPQLIVSDVHMPVLDGRGLLEELRSRGNQAPIIMLTADEDQVLEAELVLRGANAFVEKRRDPRIILAWINNLLNRKVSGAELVR